MSRTAVHARMLDATTPHGFEWRPLADQLTRAALSAHDADLAHAERALARFKADVERAIEGRQP